MSETSETVERLPAPVGVREVRCPLCSGLGLAVLNPVRVARQCPTCRGVGVYVSDRFDDDTDRMAYQVGLAPRVARKTRDHRALA